MTQAQPQAIAATVNLTKVFTTGESRVIAVNNVNVQFAQGSFTAVMGPSGSGKSTLMHCLAGLDRPTSGQVYLAGTEITSLNDKELTRVRREHVGFVFQSFNLLPTLTAEQNILLPLELAGRKPDPTYLQQLVRSLDIVDRLSHRPSQLSGGQQQRVAIARALITRPAVIFADEPTGALDTKTGTTLLEYLRRSSVELGQTIVMVTHDPRAASFANRALVLVDGVIQQDINNPTQELVQNTMAALV